VRKERKKKNKKRAKQRKQLSSGGKPTGQETPCIKMLQSEHYGSFLI
jgi:hypothetical protein